MFAESHANVVAPSIIGAISGEHPARRFSGDGFCFLEAGGGEASAIEGSFLTAPPALEIQPPSRHGFERKLAFEQDRLSRWFGGPGAVRHEVSR